MTQCELDFSGKTYVPQFDRERLNAQQRRVFDLMLDGEWRTLEEIRKATHDPEASISARLRDLRNGCLLAPLAIPVYAVGCAQHGSFLPAEPTRLRGPAGNSLEQKQF